MDIPIPQGEFELKVFHELKNFIINYQLAQDRAPHFRLESRVRALEKVIFLENSQRCLRARSGDRKFLTLWHPGPRTVSIY